MNKPFSEQLLENFTTAYNNLINDNKYIYYYKYMPLDQTYQSLNAIKNNTLKFTQPCNFNDPYDSRTLINIDNQLYSDQDNFIEKFRKRYAICCFTADPLNILMWSHYASHHCGFVMEFKIEKSVLNQTIPILIKDYPFPVSYDNTFPVINFPSSDQKRNEILKTHEKISEFLKKSLLTKAECWIYEKELRLIFNTHLNHDYKVLDDGSVLKTYEPKTLSKIILGSNIKDECREHVLDAVKTFNKKNNQDVNVVAASLMKNEFKIEINS